MGYLTEKEYLDRYQYYTIQLEKQLVKGEDFETLSDQLPCIAHISDSRTFEIIHVNKKYTDMAGYELEEVQENWMQYVLNTIHPASVKNILSFLPGFYHGMHPSQSTWFIQYARLHKQKEYSPLIVFTNSNDLPNGEVLWVVSSPQDFGKHEKKIEQIIKMDEFKLKHFRRFQSLTSREVEILGLLANGHNNREVAEKLYLARSTVETHRKHLKSKLELKSLRDLMRYAFAFNLVEI